MFPEQVVGTFEIRAREIKEQFYTPLSTLLMINLSSK
jgi:hypothetical protein